LFRPSLERENPPFFYNRLSRLYSIRSLALAICNTNLQALIEELAHNSIDAMQIATTTNQICNLIGSGWGFITTSHLLTDLGLSIKPDLHVQRSAHHLGLVPQQAAARTTAIAVIDFSKRVASELSQDQRSTLREVDKVLMEWSRTFDCRVGKENTYE
jgi:Na+-driven multidrug efflux pump